MDSYDLVLIDSEPSNVVSFHINYGDFTDQYTTTGIVVGEDYIIDIAFSYIDEYMINIDVNSDFSESDIILRTDGTNRTIDCEGRVVNVSEINQNIIVTYIDYSKLYVLSNIPNVDRNIVSLRTPVIVTYNENSSSSEIHEIGFNVTNDLLATKLENSLKLLPGTEVIVSYEREVINDVYYILNDFLSEDNNGYYIHMKNNSEFEDESEYTKIYVDVIKQNDIVSIIDFDNIEEQKDELYAKIYW